LEPGSQGGNDAADVAPADHTVARQRENVTGQHVDPPQATPASRPDRPFRVVGDRAGHLLSSHRRVLVMDTPMSQPSPKVASAAAKRRRAAENRRTRHSDSSGA
jgi:hypothetical protein